MATCEPPRAVEASGRGPLGRQASVTGLRLDVPELSVRDSASSDGSLCSPGRQPDERSPDASVYPSQWNTEWLQTELGRSPSRRTRLPEPAEPARSLKIWSLIKDWVGKDISRLSVPVHINEPLCELQKRAEGIQNSYLLDQAAQMPAHSRERLLLVTAFSVSIYSNLVRTTKPFKDLQNSTYELVYPERGYRLIGEKVAHTPATHCVLCEGRRWRFLAFDEAHLEFSLQCYIRLKPVGVMSVTFDDGDVYEWNQVPIYIQGLVMGPLSLDHKGRSQIICKATGNRTRIGLSSQGALSRMWRGNAHQVSGSLEEGGQAVPGLEISGRWDESLHVKHPDGSQQLLWRYKAPDFLDPRFKLTPHALELHEVLPEMQGKLPPTDVRLRPDMRLFEDGYADKANVEKERLEHKQRLDRQRREAAGEAPRQARWFEQVPARSADEMPRWRYRGGYWEARETGEWRDLPDIYGPGGEFAAKAADAAGRGSMKASEMLV